MTFIRHLFVFFVMIALSGSAVAGEINASQAAITGGQPCNHTIFLIRHGWHTSIALRRCDISTADWPESRAIRCGNFIEVGWGDKDYLCGGVLNPLVMAKAGCLPSCSALHVAGIHGCLKCFFDKSQIIAIKISPCQMRKLCRFIHNSYARDNCNRPICLKRSIYGCGGIYRARGHYFVPNTCNVWTAKALEAAELPVCVPLCTFADPLVCQAKRFGCEIQKRASKLPVIYPFVNFDHAR